MPKSRIYFFFVLFTLSGFSGLIYESIWSHYLKLFLGHAAYAQTLVLAIFMGGMAIGAWLSGLLSIRWRRLLIGYAIVEIIIGFLALVFHTVFIDVTEFTFSTLISGMGDTPLLVIAIKWAIASLLIFPQSVLLGMTFPLMVGGVLRHFPEKPGHTLSMLYFTNSFGAVIGVLTSSFVLIGSVGLPGTMLTAGLINIILALIVWGLAKNYIDPAPLKEKPSPTSAPLNTTVTPQILLLVALLTGLSSFMYEIGWIRMMVFVMGGSTHSFELMLAAFILGIALGGFWIRNRIDQIKDSRVFLGYVQIAMGLAAVLSIWLYQYSFDLMGLLHDVIQRKDSTYPIYLFFSGFIAILIMLPATFCAGMTLPLITRLILRTNKGESGIGFVYSANTLGAIIGIFLSVHLIMPLLGLKNLIGIAAAIDVMLGFYLLGIFSTKTIPTPLFRKAFIGVASIVLCVSILVVEFDIKRMASGVFREGKVETAGEVIYFKDGKTGSISVVEYNEFSQRVLVNNGKPDASIAMDPDAERANDEGTQILVGALPFMHHPEAKTAAMIGMGSGMSTHALLASPNLESVDTIEVEAAVFEAARLFLPVVDRAYNDPRSHLFVEDAKTFFSIHEKKYDIVVSEPSNPWVSGVATLFSKEFYNRIKNHIAPGGIFVQWIQLYEIDEELVASIFNALGSEFQDYTLYNSGAGDIIIIASPDRPLTTLNPVALDFPNLKPLLKNSGINNYQDVELHRIGSKRVLAPLFKTLNYNYNSDYFPILDTNASRTRFTGASALQIRGLLLSVIPALNILDRRLDYPSRQYTASTRVVTSEQRHYLIKLRDRIINYNSARKSNTKREYLLERNATVVRYSFSHCVQGSTQPALDELIKLGFKVVPLLTQAEQKPLWEFIATTSCFTQQEENSELTQWLQLFQAINTSNYKEMSTISKTLLDTKHYNKNIKSLTYLLSIGILGDAMRGRVDLGTAHWHQWYDKLGREPDIMLLLILSAAGIPLTPG